MVDSRTSSLLGSLRARSAPVLRALVCAAGLFVALGAAAPEPARAEDQRAAASQNEAETRNRSEDREESLDDTMSPPGSAVDEDYRLGRYLAPAVLFLVVIALVALLLERSSDT